MTQAARREKFETRRIRLVGPAQVRTALAALSVLPIDPDRPIEVVFQEEKKTRGLDANALMWVGPLADISEQVWVGTGECRRRLSDKCWHEIYKRLYLPDEFDPEMCKEGYQKWDYDENGEPILIGSTTDLTVKGFAIYVEQVFADGANRGVQFRANPKEGRR
jgi:hypothetical protein